MRTSRCILYTFLGTALSLLYVFQQTEIVKLGYKITATEKVLQAAQDRKTALEYTCTSLESPSSLDKSLLMQKDGYEIAQSYKFVKVDMARVKTASIAKTHRQGSGSVFQRLAFQSIFSGKTAEAKTVQ